MELIKNDSNEVQHYAISDSKKKEIESRFSYHAPKGDQQIKYMNIRDAAKNIAFLLVDHCPESRELSTALTKLDEVVMFANASIARNE